jgi:hypothetical protein
MAVIAQLPQTRWQYLSSFGRCPVSSDLRHGER